MHKSTEKHQKRVKQLISLAGKFSIYEIAEQMNSSTGAIQRLAASYKISLAYTRKHFPPEDIQAVLDMKRAGITNKQISQSLSVPRTTSAIECLISRLRKSNRL